MTAGFTGSATELTKADVRNVVFSHRPAQRRGADFMKSPRRSKIPASTEMGVTEVSMFRTAATEHLFRGRFVLSPRDFDAAEPVFSIYSRSEPLRDLSDSAENPPVHGTASGKLQTVDRGIIRCAAVNEVFHPFNPTRMRRTLDHCSRPPLRVGINDSIYDAWGNAMALVATIDYVLSA